MTLTNTLACRRSRVTSTPVTVTSPVMRGSFASSARNVATSSRMASATRSERRCSVAMHALRTSTWIQACARPIPGAIALDDVADLDVVEVLDADTALEPFAHFAHVVLEALERRERAVEHLDAVANDAHAALAVDDAAADRAAGDRSDARDLEHLAHFGFAEHDFALFGTQHAFHRGANVGHRFVDDAVQLDLDAFALGRRARVVVGTHVEADDDRARRPREQDVALGDRADAAVNDFDLHFAASTAR